MPRGSRPARAARHGSSHGRSIVKGNNRFGSKGCMKCEDCRRRKTRCEYDEKTPDDPCTNCRKRGTKCGKALPTQQPVNYARSTSSSTSPEPSDAMTSSSESESPREHIVIEVELPPSDEMLPSKCLEEWVQCAKQLESQSPRRPSLEVWQEIIPQFIMPILHKVEHPDSHHFYHRGYSDVERIHVPHHWHANMLTDGSSINPSTLELVSDVLPCPNAYPERWVAEGGQSPASHEDYVFEDSHETSTSYKMEFTGHFGVMPMQTFGFPPAHPLPLPYPTGAGREYTQTSFEWN